MILSDRSLREEIAAGRIVIDPFDGSCIQPSSVDVHIDRYFRVFRNHTTGYIDVKEDQEDLTELIEIAQDDVFILHPGEFVLGSTLERVVVPNDLVARIDGKSSLGRLGLLIHSSLPASEEILVLDGSGLRRRTIGEVVQKRIEGSVVSYDPETFQALYAPITGWYEGPADRIFEVRLASGRSVRLTAGHNLFSLDREGQIHKLRVQELTPGRMVAIPRSIPEPPGARASFDLRQLVPDGMLSQMVVSGPTVAGSDGWDRLEATLTDLGYRHSDRCRRRGQLPAHLARSIGPLWDILGPQDRIRPRGARYGLPVRWDVDEDLAWLIGLFIAEGHRRAHQVSFAHTDQVHLDRVERILRRWDLPTYRVNGSVACSSSMLSRFLGWIGTGDKAPTKRVPEDAFGWPRPLLESLLQGLIDGDGLRGDDRRCCFTCSPGLVSDILRLAPRLGIRATASFRDRARHGRYQISMPYNEHTRSTAVPLPDRLLVRARQDSGLLPNEAAALAGYRRPTDLGDIEKSSGRDAVRLATLRTLTALYAERAADSAAVNALRRLTDGDLAWDRVAEVVDTGTEEPIYDIEVRPEGRKIENFVAGSGGVFVSNTAGFVDAGWNGHLTLELSNVANLPITLYPGMKIGQISFLRMTTEADHPYGSTEMGSKYQHQRGPTPSRYFENFRRP